MGTYFNTLLFIIIKFTNNGNRSYYYDVLKLILYSVQRENTLGGPTKIGSLRIPTGHCHRCESCRSDAQNRRVLSLDRERDVKNGENVFNSSTKYFR